MANILIREEAASKAPAAHFRGGGGGASQEWWDARRSFLCAVGGAGGEAGCPTGPLRDPSPNQPPATQCVPAHVMAVHGWLDRVYCFLAYFKYSWNLPHPLANWGTLTSKPHNLSIS